MFPKIGDLYWKFDSKLTPPVDPKYPKPLKNWMGLPKRIDAAFKWENGLTYFFRENEYYRFNDGYFEVNINRLIFIQINKHFHFNFLKKRWTKKQIRSFHEIRQLGGLIVNQLLVCHYLEAFLKIFMIKK